MAELPPMTTATTTAPGALRTENERSEKAVGASSMKGWPWGVSVVLVVEDRRGVVGCLQLLISYMRRVI
jgi:hypothetical protein